MRWRIPWARMSEAPARVAVAREEGLRSVARVVWTRGALQPAPPCALMALAARRLRSVCASATRAPTTLVFTRAHDFLELLFVYFKHRKHQHRQQKHNKKQHLKHTQQRSPREHQALQSPQASPPATRSTQKSLLISWTLAKKPTWSVVMAPAAPMRATAPSSRLALSAKRTLLFLPPTFFFHYPPFLVYFVFYFCVFILVCLVFLSLLLLLSSF